MHLLDQRASRSTSSIIDHPNAHGTCTYLHRRVYVYKTGYRLFQLKQHPQCSCSMPVFTKILVASRNALPVIRISDQSSAIWYALRVRHTIVARSITHSVLLGSSFQFSSGSYLLCSVAVYIENYDLRVSIAQFLNQIEITKMMKIFRLLNCKRSDMLGIQHQRHFSQIVFQNERISCKRWIA